MGRTACTEPQCLYKGALYLLLTASKLFGYLDEVNEHTSRVSDVTGQYLDAAFLNP